MCRSLVARPAEGRKAADSIPVIPTIGLWLRLVEHSVRGREVARSNRANPTTEGGAQWWATGLENRAGGNARGFDSFTFLHPPLAQSGQNCSFPV